MSVKLDGELSEVYGVEEIGNDTVKDNQGWVDAMNALTVDREGATSLESSLSTGKGMVIPDDYDITKVGNYLRYQKVRDRGGKQWDTGDSALFLINKKKMTLAQIAQLSGLAIKTLKNYIRTSFTFPIAMRYEPDVLPFNAFLFAMPAVRDGKKAEVTAALARYAEGETDSNGIVKKLSGETVREKLIAEGILTPKTNGSGGDGGTNNGVQTETTEKSMADHIVQGMKGEVKDKDGNPILFKYPFDYPPILKNMENGDDMVKYWSQEFAALLGLRLARKDDKGNWRVI